MHRAKMMMVMLPLLAACQSMPPVSAAKQDLARIRTEIALQYLQAGQLDLAMQQTQMALDADPNHAKAIGVMARVYQSDGSVANLEKARQLYQKALAMDGTDMALHHQYAMFLTAQKEYQAAIEHFGIAGEHIGYADRVIALENLAYLKVEQVRMLPTDAHYQAAVLAIDRAISAGSQLGDQMHQTLSAYWLSPHHSHQIH